MSLASGVDLLAGRYQLHEPITSGGSREVWRATDVLLARPVAVKLLYGELAADPAILARFRATARRVGAVAHANIARVYDYDEPAPDGPPFLVMEFVAGSSLAELLAAGPLHQLRVLDLIAQIAAGLQAAHAAGLVHGDLKPENVLLTPDGLVKLIGFGNSSVGSKAADLYALGLVAVRCLTGQPPSAGPPAQAGASAVLPLLASRVPAAVAELVTRLASSHPQDRPPSAAEVLAAAVRLRDDLGASYGEREARGSEDSDRGRNGQLREQAAVPAWPDEPAGEAGEPEVTTSPLPATHNDRARLHVLLPVLALAVALAAFVVLTVLTPGPRPPAADSARATLVNVNAAMLRGRPVPAVRARLRHLGLAVRVRWRVSSAEPSGRVLAVRPSGWVRADSVVTVIGAIGPGQQVPPAGRPSTRAVGHHRRVGGGGTSGSPPPSPPAPSPPGSPPPSPTPTPSPSPTPSGSPTPAPSPTSQASTAISASPPGRPRGGIPAGLAEAAIRLAPHSG